MVLFLYNKGMKTYRSLPEGYKEMFQINLQTDKKTAFAVNLLSVAVNVGVLAAGVFIVPFTELFRSQSLTLYFLQLGVLIVGYIAYIILHELTHGAVMKAVGASSVIFGFTGLYAFAGSKEDYFEKIPFRMISLAPLVVWGIVFAALCFIVPVSWFWVVWFLEAANCAGAAGDVYVTAKLWKMPDSILIRDTGVDMTIYDREQAA